ncbi:hypothetical protein HDU67_006785 [Dinochytrium kinnereticum]|nr:hypothetical protein HDU67_006785 [Dinochytrium kinnereticum]
MGGGGLLDSYVSEYVRNVVEDGQLRETMLMNLKMGEPFVVAEYMAVVMIDISGYSSLTSKLAEMGKVSSEIITQSVGEYLSEALPPILKALNPKSTN